MKPSEVLQKAHERLSVHGAWGKKFFSDGELCLSLAITDPNDKISEALADEYVEKVLDVDTMGKVFAWNDAPERTLPEVLAVLLKARDLALADGQ